MSTQLHRIHQHRSLCDAGYRLVDAISILAGFVFATGLSRLQLTHSLWLAAVLSVLAFLFFAEFTALYRNWRGIRFQNEAVAAVMTWMGAACVVFVMGYFTEYFAFYSRSMTLVWLTVTGVLLVLLRLAVRKVQQVLRTNGYNVRRFAIVGVNDLARQLVRNIEASSYLGLELDGFYDDRPGERTGGVPDELGEQVGNIDESISKTKSGEVNMIYITFPMRAEDRIRDVLSRLSDSTASVYIVPDFFVFELLHSRWTNIGGLPAVSVFENPLYGVDGLLKRTLDLVLTTIGLVILAIPMMLIAALVKFTSPGPVFFRQKRYGLDGQEILVWKYRSMQVCENGDRVTQATKNDSRITKIGGILRKTSLDELPQLFNVLAGTMSLVGPRPHANAHNEQYRQLIEGYMLRHKVKPGITGLAQVNGWRGETDTLEKMEKRIEFDHRYIKQWSLWLDIKVLFKTIFVVLSRQNAY